MHINGAPVFRTAQSSYIDVIEKCAAWLDTPYETALGVAQSALKQVGRPVRIDHDSSVAATFVDNGKMIRCGVLHRNSGHSAIFSFTAESKGERTQRITQTVEIAADYLEFFNLQFALSRLRAKEYPTGTDLIKMREILMRQGVLNRQILSFEDVYAVKYRPGKPDMSMEA